MLMDDYWLVDLHTHTVCSDGLMTVKELLVIAKRAGLTGIAVTDHDTTRCVREALRLGEKLGIIVVPGVEITTREAHLLLYGITFELPRKYKNKPHILEVLDFAYENNLFSSIAHPYGRFLRPYPVVYLREALEKVNGIEVINGRTPVKSNIEAINLSLKYGKTPTAGSDAHIPEEVGSAKILLREPVEDYIEVIDQMVKGKHLVYGGRSIWQIGMSIFKKQIRTFLRRIRGKGVCSTS